MTPVKKEVLTDGENEAIRDQQLPTEAKKVDAYLTLE
jgi:hypothetical protein